MKVTATSLNLLASLLLISSVGCMRRLEATPQSSVPEGKSQKMLEKSSLKGRWIKTQLPLEGEVITFGKNGHVAVAGTGTLLLSLDDGQSWQTLTEGNGDYLYTKDGGKTFLANNSDPRPLTTIKVSDLCNVESAVIAPSGRLYLTSVCEHTEQVWSVPVETRSGIWHVRTFTYQRNPEDGVWGPRGNLVAAGGRILIDAVLPEGPALMTTDDEGATWYPFWRGEHGDALIVALEFINERQGWMLKGDGKFLSTENGGRTWLPISTLPTEASGHAFSFDFVNSTTGFIVGKQGLILVTSDGGHSWQLQITDVKQSLYKVAAADAKNAWAVGEAGTVLQTNDGGMHWQKVELGLRESPRTLAINHGAAWLVMDDFVYQLSQ